MGDSQPACDWTTAPDTFENALEDLKSTGCMLLVVESSGGTTDRTGCNRMLGETALEDRRHLFVRTDVTETPSADSTAQSNRRTVVYETGARSTATTPESATASTPESATAVRDGVDDLVAAADEEVEALAPPGGFEPAQLRVCVDGVGELIADTDLAAVLSFVERVRGTVTASNGIGHVHVDDSVPATAIEGLLEQFDAVVEVRENEDPRQRWHLPEESVSTEWLDL